MYTGDDADEVAGGQWVTPLPYQCGVAVDFVCCCIWCVLRFSPSLHVRHKLPYRHLFSLHQKAKKEKPAARTKLTQEKADTFSLPYTVYGGYDGRRYLVSDGDQETKIGGRGDELQEGEAQAVAVFGKLVVFIGFFEFDVMRFVTVWRRRDVKGRDHLSMRVQKNSLLYNVKKKNAATIKDHHEVRVICLIFPLKGSRQFVCKS